MIIEYLVKKLSVNNDARIDKKHCIYYRNRFKRCVVCMEVCKYEAITSSEDEIKIDNEKCKKCGLCKAQCPSQAVTIDNFGEIDLLKKSEKNCSLCVGCEKNLNSVDFSFKCLNGIHIEYLIAFLILNKDHEIAFKLNHCKDCDLNSSDNIEEKIKLSINFLKKLNINVKVKCIYEESPDCGKERLMTRRDFFNSIKGESTNIFKEFVVSTLEEYYGKEDFNNRSFLLNVISKLKKTFNEDVDLEGNIFKNFKVKSNCDGCGLCEGICPYDAWKITETEESFKIEYNCSKCRGCRLCIDLCSNNSIEEEKVKLSYINNEYVEKLKKKK
ncbi:4Fe-4S ferredoxin [Clostridium carboxidivorans P7]|uniref:4Fe-4S ferredoxin iron-sulfur binding domain protein n=1 Tax=Clostridium carboxidivorans P7 TaxID=536227 RepID=C6PWT5_9CLOT|nr:4Fe-4S dicluster domain-containing protein [Clostridium carboxidivorans]AKN31983.1 4Fe-4S ferredoxin [Clostridium carboxidivorans P7]EET86310.1 4Fe-4S ferredoxin iron-sulfur binding domain protein [Clostridium carboxidivorans P7]EFG87882.1 4Fe-4S binding domain protein [Clostridium carboxidivorans P7]